MQYSLQFTQQYAQSVLKVQSKSHIINQSKSDTKYHIKYKILHLNILTIKYPKLFPPHWKSYNCINVTTWAPLTNTRTSLSISAFSACSLLLSKEDAPSTRAWPYIPLFLTHFFQTITTPLVTFRPITIIETTLIGVSKLVICYYIPIRLPHMYLNLFIG